MEELTGRQREILHFIVRQTEERGFPPTIREIGEEMDIRSTNGVNDHLKALERKGYLLRGEQQSRALVPTKRARLVLGMGAPRRDPGMVEVPLLGKVAAGAPLLAVENVEDSVRIDSFLLGGSGKEVFALRVKGDSMIDAGILDGDFVVVRQQEEAEKGDIVVAGIPGEEATVKTYSRKGGKVVLVPANTRLEPMVFEPDDVTVFGKVVTVLRRL